MHVKNKPNPYQAAFPDFSATPKAVIAAIAYSLAQRLCEDDAAAAAKMIRDEWVHLHASGIVPQKPSGVYLPSGSQDDMTRR